MYHTESSALVESFDEEPDCIAIDW